MSIQSPVASNGSLPAGVAPPHSIKAEQALLGAILLTEKAPYTVAFEERLDSSHFYRERHPDL